MAKITINDFAKKAYKKYINAGMTPAGACGLMGNQYAESAGFIANRVEFLCLKRLKENGKTYTDETYTAAVDSGKVSKAEFLNPLPEKQYGYGISQFTTPTRKSGLYSFTVEKGKSIADEDAQLDYVIHEMNTTFPKTFNVLKTATSVKEASDYVLVHYESPADTGSTMKNTRADYSQQYYDYFTAVNKEGDNMTIIQKIIDDAVDFAVGIANDNSHGYSQAVRSLFITTNSKSFDCSSLVLTAFYYAFIKNGLTKQAEYIKQNCSYTGNMCKLKNCGFEVVATNQTAHSQMQKGDIELNEIYHTALAIDKDNIVHARTSEGTNNTTDDSGNEIRVQPWYLYSHGWTHRLRFTGKGIDFSNISNSATQSSSKPSTSTTTTSTSSSSKLNEIIKWTGVTTDLLNVRKWAGIEYGTCSFSPLKKGAEIGVCDVVKASDGSDWYYIKYQGKTGFVSGKYVEKASSTTTSASTAYSKTQFTKDVQSVIGATVDGIAGTQTLSLVPTVSKTQNNRHAVVIPLQKHLNSIGYNVGNVDGWFGDMCDVGIKNYQKDNGLVADGIIGQKTWKVLLCN